MKTTSFKSVFLFNIIFLSCLSANSQTGIYLSSEHFVRKTISYTNSKIKLHEVFYKSFIEVKTKDSAFKLNKADVYGYVNKQGAFRFYNNESYPVLNPGEKILIYKKTSGTGLKDSPVTDTYYFSKDVSSPVLLLTLRNIERVFAGDSKFEKLIEIHFVKDADLTEFDHLHNMYKLNRLLDLSAQQ